MKMPNLRGLLGRRAPFTDPPRVPAAAAPALAAQPIPPGISTPTVAARVSAMTAPFAHLLGLGGPVAETITGAARQARRKPALTAGHAAAALPARGTPQSSPTQPRPVKRAKPAVLRFEHLRLGAEQRQAAAEAEAAERQREADMDALYGGDTLVRSPSVPAVADPAKLARAITRAGEKVRQPMQAPAAPTGTAAKIIAAAEAARRPTSAPEPTGLAAQIIEAGRKRRRGIGE